MKLLIYPIIIPQSATSPTLLFSFSFSLLIKFSYSKVVSLSTHLSLSSFFFSRLFSLLIHSFLFFFFLILFHLIFNNHREYKKRIRRKRFYLLHLCQSHTHISFFRLLFNIFFHFFYLFQVVEIPISNKDISRSNEDMPINLSLDEICYLLLVSHTYISFSHSF